MWLPMILVMCTFESNSSDNKRELTRSARSLQDQATMLLLDLANGKRPVDIMPRIAEIASQTTHLASVVRELHHGGELLNLDPGLPNAACQSCLLRTHSSCPVPNDGSQRPDSAA